MEPRRQRYLTGKDIPLSFHKEALSNAVGKFERVVFTSGEPTTYEGLKELIAYAHNLRFKEIALITNGRLLSDSEFMDSLIANGMNLVSVSIHAHKKEFHESLTRAPGSFAQSVNALLNIKKRRDSGIALSFTINMTLTKLNYIHLPDSLRFFNYFNPDKIILNFFNPISKAEKRTKLLLPKYSEVIDLLRNDSSITDIPFVLIDFPACTAKDFISHIGSIEDYHIRKPGQKPTDVLYRDNLERGKSKNMKCSKCLFQDRCHGFTKAYLELYGDEEISPFKEHLENSKSIYLHNR